MSWPGQEPIPEPQTEGLEQSLLCPRGKVSMGGSQACLPLPGMCVHTHSPHTHTLQDVWDLDLNSPLAPTSVVLMPLLHDPTLTPGQFPPRS
jgi:hypothetical protein